MSLRIHQLKEVLFKLYFFGLPTSTARMNYLRKHKVFGSMGENFFFQPRKLPADPKFIRFHNNVSVAADVTFYNHDVIYIMSSKLDPASAFEHMGCIEVMDNCFIGGHSIILPGVKIGPNAIVAAGSVVTKDVKPGTVVGGNPAKVIGSFDELLARRKREIPEKSQRFSRNDSRRVEAEWNKFAEKHSDQ